MVRELQLEFKNCRNISRVDSDSLPLQYNRLNILFGSNGTGKTTISKVLDAWCNPNDASKKDDLRSFVYLHSQDPCDAPMVKTTSSRSKPILTFNSEWVGDHCFRDDGNLQVGAYGLYVSSSEVRRLERERDKTLSRLGAVLANEHVEELRSLSATVAKGIGTTLRGKVGSAFKDNAPLEGLPASLSYVVRRLRDKDKAQWMCWHVQGVTYARSVNPVCPYCGNTTSDIQPYIDFDNMHAIKQGDAWTSVISVFAQGKLFRVTVNRKALKLLSGAKQLEAADKQWVIDTGKRAKELLNCILRARDTVATFGGNSSEQFFTELQKCLLTLEDESGFTDDVRKVMREIASAVRRVLASEKKIRKLVEDLEGKAANNALAYKAEIDFMLEKCGYPYTIEIDSNCANKESRVMLCPVNASRPLEEQPKRTLSYGEQNTLALILFMFEAIATPDRCIIVIDDPISSFDGDKRFALLYRMFHNFKKDGPGEIRESLAGRTVVLLTHDYLVVSDALTILGNKMIKPHILRLTREGSGVLMHQEVGADSVQPYIQMIRRRVAESTERDVFFQLVYLRCYCEMMRHSRKDKKTGEGCAFVVISLIVDGYDWDGALKTIKWDGKSARPYILRTGESFIRKYVPSFDFKTVFDELRNDAKICGLFESSGITPYEKLQVLRLLIRQAKIADQGPIMVRYANEVYHLAGDYLLQLDPVDFNPVPPFVLDWCDNVFSEFVHSLQIGN